MIALFVLLLLSASIDIASAQLPARVETPYMVGRGTGGSRHAYLEGFDLYPDVWVAANNGGHVLLPQHRSRST